MLDTGILGMVVHPRKHEDVQEWFDRALLRHEVLIPEIADYELRRELVRIGSSKSIAILDRLESELARYVPLTTGAMKRAAELWAGARQGGHGTSSDDALDGDVILSAQAMETRSDLVVTTNVSDIERFVRATGWSDQI